MSLSRKRDGILQAELGQSAMRNELRITNLSI